MSSEDCSTCRHHSKTERAKVVGEAMDDIVEFSDDNETVYHCRSTQGPYAHREVGPVPVRCSAYCAPQPLDLEHLDALMARLGNRTKREDER